MEQDKRLRIVMNGDSITDCGRGRPVGTMRGGQLGDGYAGLFGAMLAARRPGVMADVLNVGVSGDTTRRLKARWQADVMDLRPDWLTVLIGINDVWRQFDMPFAQEPYVLIDEYEANLAWMLDTTLPVLKGCVLMAPYYIEPCRDDAMRAMMDEYGAVVRRLAKKYGTLFVDTQAAFDRYLEHHYSVELASDRVHPNTAGHMIIAEALWEAMQAGGAF